MMWWCLCGFQSARLVPLSFKFYIQMLWTIEPNSVSASIVSQSMMYSIIRVEILTVAIASRVSSITQPNQFWNEDENDHTYLPRPSNFCFDRIHIRMATMETHTMLGKIAKNRQTGCRPLFPMVRRCEAEELERRADICHWRRRFCLFLSDFEIRKPPAPCNNSDNVAHTAASKSYGSSSEVRFWHSNDMFSNRFRIA